MQVCQYQVKVLVTFQHSCISTEQLRQEKAGQNILPNLRDYMISFYDVNIKNLELAAAKKRAKTTEIMKSEMHMIIELDNQRVEFDIEQPQGADKKNPLNTFFFYKYKHLDLTELNRQEEEELAARAEAERNQLTGGAGGAANQGTNFLRKEKDAIRITFEERIFKLERDEQAFIDQLQKVSTTKQSAMNSFLMKKTGGYGGANQNGDLGSMMKKKKTLTKKNVIL